MAKGKSNKEYSGAFKQTVIETMRAEGMSYKETARQFGINGHSIIQRWERIYLEEGAKGLYIERRGRKSTGRPLKLNNKAEEDLIAENQRLRMELDYLKNLQALVLESERHQRKKSR